VWGEGWQAVHRVPRKRIIPTRVGRRTEETMKKTLNEDHPHACGEKQLGTKKMSARPGSSPRVWGEGVFFSGKFPGRRIIPTRVGRSSNSRFKAESKPDHPHACGEKRESTRGRTLIFGSSPRVWGEANSRFKGESKARIIPTRVGRR